MINKLKKRMEKRAPVTDALWSEVQEHSKLMYFKKNEVLISYSSIHKYVYFVASGSFISTLILENGLEQAVWFYLEDLFDFIRTQEIGAHRLVHTSLDFIKYIQNKYPLLISRISSKDMAYFTGISPEWYSKLKKKVGVLN